jgi:FMN phosphatase YigB (HAD superfamily)
MFKAILFDLDGTLLPLDMDVFLVKYMKALSRRVQMDTADFSKELMASTVKMIQNDGSVTNMEVFAEDFFPRFKRERQELEDLIEQFYREDFPKLGAGIDADPAARSAVEAAFAITRRVVIATNSVFPRSAILDRMRWAGVADFPYTLVTSYEEMHWAKPNPNYYREIVKQLKVKPQDALMIGNDVEEDLIAGELGMKTFLVDEMLIHRSGGKIRCDWRGSMADCAELLWNYAKREEQKHGCIGSFENQAECAKVSG